jgi:thioredoxin reductase
MYDIAIIGAGPAGATAALYAAKAGKKTLLVDDGKSVTKRALMKNYYGLSEVTGPELVETGKKQVVALGGELVEATVSALESLEGGVRLQVGDRPIEAKHVILATGMVASLAEASGVTTKPGTEPRIKTIVDVDSQGKTNVPNVWAAGTIAGVSMHVIITAGDGARVAINLISELNGERYVDHDVMPAPANA